MAADSFVKMAKEFSLPNNKNLILSLVGILALGLYFNKFLTFSLDWARKVSASIFVSGVEYNDVYFPLGDSITYIGMIFLVSFFLIERPWQLQHKSRYYTTYFAIGMFIIIRILFGGISSISPLIEISPRTQAPFLLVVGPILVTFLLIQGELKNLLILIVDSIKSPSDAKSLWNDSWKKVIVSLFSILIFLLLLFTFPLIQPTILTILCMMIILGWGLRMSQHLDTPSVAANRYSSMILFVAIPIILYLIFRIMILSRTDNSWDVTFDFMKAAGEFPVINWPNQIDSTSASRWEFHWAGVINAVRAVLLSIFFCTLLGAIIGVMRLSSNKLSSFLGMLYVEGFRNMPLALLLFGLATFMGQSLPRFQEEANIAESIWYSNQGIFIPALDSTRFAIGIAILLLVRAITKYMDRNGYDDNEKAARNRILIWVFTVSLTAAFVVQAGIDIPSVWKRNSSPGSWEMEGGFQITSPFIGLVAGLTLYTSAIVAEIVRGSIQSLPRGQVEAAISLSLSPIQRLRLVIIPQALRSMIPALNNQYMNVWKNSSLALIVAYNDIFQVNFVIVNKVGKAVPTFMLILITYQIGSLLISAVMNYYNSKVTKVKI